MQNTKMSEEVEQLMMTSIEKELDEVKSNFDVMKIKKYYLESNKGKLIFVSFGSDIENINDMLLSSIFNHDTSILHHIDKEIKKFVCYQTDKISFLEYKLKPFLVTNPNADLTNHNNCFYDDMIYFDYLKKHTLIDRIKYMFGFNVKLNWLCADDSISTIFERVKKDLNLKNEETIFVFTNNGEL